MGALQFSWDAEPRTWPQVPRKFVFLANAFNEVGRALHPETWTGKEALPPLSPESDKLREIEQQQAQAANMFRAQRVRPAAKLPAGYSRVPQLPSTPGDPLPHSAHVVAFHIERARQRVERIKAAAATEAAANQVIIDRRNSVAEWIAVRGRDGDLETLGLWAGGGFEPLSLSPAVWITSNDWSVFERCQVKRWSGVNEYTYFVLVTRESLDAQLAAYTRKSLGESVSRARAQGEAEDWLRERFADEATQSIGKPEFKARAQSQIRGLSGEAFERAWGNVVREFPERSAKGRKRANKSGGNQGG